MAYITQFAVTGLAGRSDTVKFKLHRDTNVFFGLNGSGKTSLLKLLDSAMSGDVAPIVDVPFEKAEVSIYSEDFGQTFTRRITREAIKRASVEHAPPRLTLSPSGEVVSHREIGAAWKIVPPLPDGASGKWSHIYLPITRMYASVRHRSTYSGDDAMETIDEQVNRAFTHTLQSLWRAYFTNILSEVRQAQAEGLASILEAVLSSKERVAMADIDPDVAYSRVIAFLRRQGPIRAVPAQAAFVKRLRDDARLRSVVNDIEHVERRIAAAMEPRNRLEELISRLFNSKHVQFRDDSIAVSTDDDRSFDLGLLSSGEKQVLRLLVDTLRAERNSLIVDEPELSMHVDWQQELIGVMRQLNPDAQLIMATHSPEVMAEVTDENIFRL